MDWFLALAAPGAQEASSAGMSATAADSIVLASVFLCGLSLAAAVVTGGLVLALALSAARR
jgi:hypothetical protein